MLGQKGHCTSSDLCLILIKMERVAIGKKGKASGAGAAVLLEPGHCWCLQHIPHHVLPLVLGLEGVTGASVLA